MYLKRLELQGFKSFPEKIKLEFNKGITAVVGPNGSGKSNVSDAVRWVLGEQSVKSLRGAKMEDVIFAGTQNRRPLGFAEVCMVIDNTDYEMRTEFSEITVTRRVYRSGESQFMINGVPCRLKDIHELFMDTGVGREGYSVIGQGRIEEILSTKSEDRRLLFEEAAGIVKYKNRKNEAEGKLEREYQNLLRVNDIISELESQVGPLFEQSENAKNYLGLAERQKLLNVSLFLIETENAQAAIEAIAQNIVNLQAQIENTAEESAETKEKTAELKNAVAAKILEIENGGMRLNELAISAEKLENEIKLCEQTAEHNAADVERLLRDIDSKRNTIAELCGANTAYEARHSAIILEHSVHSDKLKLHNEQLDAINERLTESERMVERYGSDHIEHIRATTDVKGRISRAEAMYEQLENRKEELDTEKSAAADRLWQCRASFDAYTEELAKKDAQTAYLAKQTEELYEEKYVLQQEIINDRANADKCENAYREAFSRHKLLCELEQSYEGYYKSVKSVLLAKKENPAKFAGIHGAVADLLTLERRYETAIEIALGGALQNIVTDSERDAQDAIEFLKRRKDGRATFLPISAVKGRDFANRAQLLNEKGVIGVAKELVGYKPVYEGVFSSLLGRTLVIDNLDNAVALSKKYKYELKLVTLEGDLLNPGGSMTGGSVNKTSASILSRGGEIADLKERIDTLSAEAEEHSRILARKDDKLNGISDAIEKNKMLIQEIELGKASVNAALRQIEQSVAELNEKTKDFETEERQLMEQIVELNRQLRQFKEEQRLLELEISDILAVMEQMQKSLNSIKSEKDAKIKEMTSVQVNISGLNENMVSIKENIDRILRDIKIAEKDIENYQNEIDGIYIKQEDLRAEIENHRAAIGQIATERTASSESIAALHKAKDILQAELDACEAAAIEKIELTARLNAELSRLEFSREQRETDSRERFDKMWDEYGLTHQAALKLPRAEGTLASIQREEREVRNAIRDLGAVNVGAIEEYKAVMERYEFLTAQRDDIMAAEQKLKEIIKELETLMERQFSEQFDIISENFSIVFSEMFGGGMAYLKLSDEGDVLNSGIDIIAQPPGKRLQNMNLFSGGERALTATALLFAILRMKPSPFCILDEVEAALDDSNVKRYANYLKNFSHKTQFIIITHRKGTMEAADTLYGVTMQEQGVSKLVSVRFGEDEIDETTTA